MGKKKSMTTKALTLTDDLIIDIISRVPDNDLMRFTCVSKPWPSLINTDSYLSQLRSHRTALLGRPFLIIEKIEYPPTGGGMLFYNYWLDPESMEDGNPNPREIHNPFDHDLDYDYDYPPRDARVVGSCEGPLVLQQRSSGEMVVSNQTTKEHHMVPPNPAGNNYVEVIGFGYDHVHGCYKLVTEIRYASSDDDVVELVVYNVNKGTWKKPTRFDGLVKKDYFSKSGCYSGQCVDGALYWCVKPGTETTKIICFVLAEEEFHEVDPPHFDEYMDYSVVTVFDGRLCLVCEGTCYSMEFWLMESNCGSSYSWRWIHITH